MTFSGHDDSTINIVLGLLLLLLLASSRLVRWTVGQCWYYGGDDMTGARHGFQFWVAPMLPPASLAALKCRQV